jgi:hypothetical protein
MVIRISEDYKGSEALKMVMSPPEENMCESMPERK